MKPNIKMENIRLADWSGFTDFGGTADVYAPRTEGEIVALVRYCRDNQKKLRVVGLQTSWNSLWYSPEVMMTTKYLDRILEIDVKNRTLTCEAGVTLEQIHKALWEKGLTLDTAPAVDWVTIGGSISTGSHGSGPASNSSSMIGCRLVTADGEVVEIGEDDERLDAVRVSMGALGILSTVTLKVVDAFYVSMQRIRIPTQDWQRYLTEGRDVLSALVPAHGVLGPGQGGRHSRPGRSASGGLRKPRQKGSMRTTQRIWNAWAWMSARLSRRSPG